MSAKNWICSNNPSHVFSKTEAEDLNYFCPNCAYGEGILMEESSPLPVSRNLGLCIMLLDCSGSMNLSAFPNHPLSKRELITTAVTAAIYSLTGLGTKAFAYMMLIGFDHETKILLPATSLEDIFNKFPDHIDFEQYLLNKMPNRNGATDINGALRIAYHYTQKFIDGDLKEQLGDYSPAVQSIIDSDLNTHSIPNVRVLLFTDGEHYLGDDDRNLMPSPFNNLSFKGKNINLLMSAFYGEEQENGYAQLLSLVSHCPKHPGTPQFFHYNTPAKLPSLKGLFRMASGASGFCPKCLEESHFATTDL